MPELNQFQDYLVHEFVDDYNDGVMPRRDMVTRIMHITGGVAAAATMLTSLGVKAAEAGVERKQYRQAATPASELAVAAGDPRVTATDVSFESSGAMVGAYEARPSDPDATPASTGTPVTAGRLPLILVCHENRGLTDHIRDVTRRLAVNGYVAVALDLVSREGGTAAHDQSEIPSILSAGDPNRHVADFQAAIDHYGTQPDVDIDRVGMIGFCFGGGITWRAATRIAALKAAIPYYGPPPPLEDVANIHAAVLGVYSDDPGDFANRGRDDLEEALKTAGKTYEIKVYPGTEHAFNNDTGPRYNPEQAAAAWSDALAWFGKYV